MAPVATVGSVLHILRFASIPIPCVIISRYSIYHLAGPMESPETRHLSDELWLELN